MYMYGILNIVFWLIDYFTFWHFQDLEIFPFSFPLYFMSSKYAAAGQTSKMNQIQISTN